MKKQLKVLLAAACVLCLAFALVGCSGGDKADTQAKESSETTKFTVGFDQDFPPYGYVGDNGEFTGFDLDLAAEVAKRNGWELELKPINWDAKDLELSSGAIDCIWNGFTIEGREDDYTFTEPYMDNSQVIAVRADSDIKTLADLADKNVMVQTDSAALHLLDEGGDQAKLAATFKEMKSIGEYNSAFMQLESGAVDAVALDLPVAKFQIAGQEDKFVILDEALSSEHYGVGFLKGNEELRDTVEKTLREMVADDAVKTIAEKYKDQGISYDSWLLTA